jgi:polygalacturonase
MNRKQVVGLLALCSAAGLAAQDCNVRDFGARPNDLEKDTVAIQAAIDACAERGGGRVLLPPGRFVSGHLKLKSNIEFHVALGAELEGSPDIVDYPKMDGAAGLDHGEDELKRDGLLVADHVDNVALTGFGTIDGRGIVFWDPGFLEQSVSRPTLPRPMPWVAFRHATAVRISDVHFVDSPSYGVTISESQFVRIERIRVTNHPKSPNTDGIQIVDSADIAISGVRIATGDDAIVLKSHRRAVEDIVVRDSVLESDDAAFKFGTGSEMPIRRISLLDTTIQRTRMGIALFMKDGGLFEDLEVRNVRFTGAPTRHTTEYPIYIDVDRRTAASKLGVIRDLRFENLRLTTRGNVLIQGHRLAPIDGITFSDVRLAIVGTPVDLTTLRGKPRGNALIGELLDSVDYARAPTHFMLAHARDVQIDDVRISAARAGRSLIKLVDVADAEAIERALQSVDGARDETP